MDTLRIAHCADIHLGGGEAPDHFYRDAFSAVLSEIRIHDPHLMLLAGDLFQSNQINSATVKWAMEILGQQPFPIFMIPGNHDCVEPDGIYLHHDFNSIANVTMLSSPSGSTAHLPELGVSVWGRGMVKHTRTYSPLGGCPPRPADCRWYLALGHGILVPHGEQTERSSPIHMREIEASECDYIALGHHHAALEIVTVNTVAVFAGSPTDNIGRGATYAIAELKTGRAPTVQIHVMKSITSSDGGVYRKPCPR
jgi:DNA repair protein SbcD/Mre11